MFQWRRIERNEKQGVKGRNEHEQVCGRCYCIQKVVRRVSGTELSLFFSSDKCDLNFVIGFFESPRRWPLV